MPEISRRIVKDGSIRLPGRINKPLFSLLKSPDWRRSIAAVAAERAMRCPNPLTCLVTLRQRATFLVILIGGIQYTIYSGLAASFCTLMIRLYALAYLTGGLIYLSCGVGGVIAVHAIGKLLDRDYVRTAKHHNLPVDKSFDDLSNFPIKRARLLSMFPLLVISSSATTGVGWALSQQISIAVPWILTFFSGVSKVVIFNVCGTFLTDLNSHRSAFVQAGYNLIRCAPSAGGLAGLQALIDGIGSAGALQSIQS